MELRTIRAINIDWETDGENVLLPTSVDVVIPRDWDDEDIDQSLADILSDEYGWLVKSIAYEEVGDNGSNK